MDERSFPRRHRPGCVDPGSVAARVPADYGETLRMLTETIASGNGSRPNDNVEKITGAPPTNFADFARRTAHGVDISALR